MNWLQTTFISPLLTSKLPRLSATLVQKHQVRCYDRVKYKAQKKLLKMGNDSYTLNECHSILQNYALDTDVRNTWKIHATVSSALKTSHLKLNHQVNQSTAKIAVFTGDTSVRENGVEGADHVGGEELLATLVDGSFSCDFLVCTPQFFPKLLGIGKVLGPLGLMPSVAKGTVGNDLAAMVTECRKKTTITSISNTITIEISHSSWPAEKFEDNVRGFVRDLLLLNTKGKVDDFKFLTGLVVSVPDSVAMELPLKPFKVVAVRDDDFWEDMK